MILELVNNTNKYVSNITCNANNVLSWDASSVDESFIIIRTEYGKKLNIENTLIEKALNNCSITDFDREIEINTDLSLILYTRISLIGYKSTIVPARYYIFVCELDKKEERLKIFIPDFFEFIDVGDTIYFLIANETQKKKGLLAKLKGNNDTKEYITVRLNGECPFGYKDGDLYYTFQNSNYIFPITRLMMKNGFTVPIPDGEPNFSIKSTSNGYNAVINKSN